MNFVLEQIKYTGDFFEHIGNNEVFTTHTRTNLAVNKNGYLYVYVSNETRNVDVFFDNVQVTHVRGPLLEETHYYPFGLTMVGISSKAAGKLENRNKYNGNELQSKEFSDGSGLELFDFNARTYDQQIGRFIQIDPETEYLQESFSPFHFGINNPILYDDPDGKNPIWGIYRGIRILAKVVEWSTSQSTAAPAVLTPTVLRDGTMVVQGVKALGDLKVLNEAKHTESKQENSSTTDSKKDNQGSGEGRGKNNRKPDSKATGDHSVSNERGSTTYEKNERNPSGFQEAKRVDTKGKADNNVPTPHVHEGGKVRSAKPEDIPKVDLSKNKPRESTKPTTQN